MARRPLKPCSVPSCKGHLELGKHPDGSEHEWCVVCERRISQLAALHARPPAPTVGEITDAQLMKLVQARGWNLSQAHKATKRSANLLTHAVKAGQIPSARIGRYTIIPRAAATEWAKNYQRKTSVSQTGLAYIAALPREEAKALTVNEWAAKVDKSPATLSVWVCDRRKDARLQVKAVLDPGRRPVRAFWWKEEAHA